jgi:hypothetical protein
MIIGVVTGLWTVFFCALAAFAFSRLRFKGRRPGLLSLLLIQMFPNLLAVVALFLFMTRIKACSRHRPRHVVGADLHLPRRRPRREHLADQGLLRHHPVQPRRVGQDRRLHPRQTFFKIILPLAAAGAGRDRAAVVHHEPGRVPGGRA